MRYLLLTVAVICSAIAIIATPASANQVPPGGGFPNFCLGHSGQIVYIYVGNILTAYHCP